MTSTQNKAASNTINTLCIYINVVYVVEMGKKKKITYPMKISFLLAKPKLFE